MRGRPRTAWRIGLTAYTKELRETLRDRRSLYPLLAFAIVMPAIVLSLHTGSNSTLSSDYEMGVAGTVPSQLAPVLSAHHLKAKPVDDPQDAIRKHQADAAVAFTPDGSKATVYIERDSRFSRAAGDAIRLAVSDYNALEASTALRRQGVDPAVLSQVQLDGNEISAPPPLNPLPALLFGLAFPLVLLFAVFIGGFYVAIDTTAGEKERHTLEALLMTSAPRRPLLLGKLMAVTTTASAAGMVVVLTTLLALATIGLPSLANFANPPPDLGPGTIATLVFSAVELSLVSAGSLVVAGLAARNFRQGSAYATPILMVVALPAFGALATDWHPPPPVFLVPVLNVALTARDALGGRHELADIGVTMLATLMLAAGLLAVASWLISRERLVTQS